MIDLDTFIQYLSSDDYYKMMTEELAKEQSYKIKVNRYINILHSMSIDDRDILFTKIKQKYESNSYKERYYKKGLMPEEFLYSIIFDYAIKYGEALDTSNELFPTGSYKIDNKWIISLIMGQGTIIVLEKMN